MNSKNKKASKNVPDINSFYEHFKFLNEESTYPEMQINNNTRSVLELDKEISEEEILQAVKSLKNNKACGDDRVINEYIRSTIGLLLPVFKCLFNYVLETGNIPQDWTLGNIIPIYKKKGDTNDPGNYRGISLLSCFGKFFTTIINLRLNIFLNLNNILLKNQTGFRKGYSSLNHVFSLKSLIDIFFSKKKKLYCAFIDFKKAFDTVWRSGLWIKLISFGITGKLFNVVRNIYDNVKSCVQLNNNKSAYFNCYTGVRQGESLSPLLFSLYLNDLESFLKYNNVKNLSLSDNVFDNYLKIQILLYADDTVIFSETPEGLQKSLNCLAEYCKCWKLSINTEKTEIVIFSKARYRGNFNFKLNGKNISIVDSFKYLGVFFNYNGSFVRHKTHLVVQSRKAMFALLKKSKELDLPIDLQLELFFFLYLKYLKYVLGLKQSTPSCMVYGETGRFPLPVYIKTRMISFWCKLVSDDENKLSSRFYNLLCHYSDNRTLSSKWLDTIKHILDHTGFSNMFVMPRNNSGNLSNFHMVIKQRLEDQYEQQWRNEINESSKCTLYRIFKTEFKFENYLCFLPLYERNTFCKFRTCNHKLPIEVGRYTNTPRINRICIFCNNNTLCDGFHFVLECSILSEVRNQFLPKYCHQRPNVLKFKNIMSSQNLNVIKKLVKYLKESFNIFDLYI